jgi:F0F1-type ATP synthase membrane subunit b/b'
MSDDGKAALLNAAVSVGQFYAFLAQGLRMVFDPKAAAQLPESLFDTRLDQIRGALAPILEKNHVVKENLQKVDQEVTRIRKAAKDAATRSEAIEEAERYHADIAERARTVSDLVGLFRRL